MPYLGVRPADITSATEAEVAGDLTVDTNTLKVDAANNRVFVGATSGDRKFEVHDTGVVVANFKSTGANSLMAFDNSSDTSQNHMIGFSGDDFRVVETTEKIRVLSSGGITFNGDTATANALSDFEQGSFTATLNGGSGHPATRVTTTGYYTKVNNQVFININFENISTASYSGSISVFGLPFACGNGASRQVFTIAFYETASFSGTGGAFGHLSATGTEIYLLNNRSGNSWENLSHAAGSGRYLVITGTYSSA
jgi:hypothetical protein